MPAAGAQARLWQSTPSARSPGSRGSTTGPEYTGGPGPKPRSPVICSLAQGSFVTVEDYLTGESVSPIKHEYVAGEVFAMAGATDAHATVAGNVFAMLRAHVRGGPCRVYMADMKLRVRPVDAFYYPDCFVTCEGADAAEPLAKERAKVVIEVLSESTEGCDRGAKFASYRRLPSLEEYVLIDSPSRSVDVFRRRPDGWILQPASEDGGLALQAIGFKCTLDQVYEDVAFAPSRETPAGDGTADSGA